MGLQYCNLQVELPPCGAPLPAGCSQECRCCWQEVHPVTNQTCQDCLPEDMCSYLIGADVSKRKGKAKRWRKKQQPPKRKPKKRPPKRRRRRKWLRPCPHVTCAQVGPVIAPRQKAVRCKKVKNQIVTIPGSQQRCVECGSCFYFT